jgi:hypothetical protein
VSNDGAEAAIQDSETITASEAKGIPRGARRILAIAVCLLLPTLVAAQLYAGSAMALGVLGGGVVALVNFWFLARIIVRTTGGEMQGSTLFARLLVKYLMLAASLGVVILLFRLDSLGLMIGVGVIFPAIMIGSLLDLFGEPADVTEALN